MPSGVYIRTEEHNLALSKALKGRSCPTRGRKQTKEHRQKISEALKGKPKSEEHKRKIRDRQITEEHRRRMSESAKERCRVHGGPMKGRKHSEEAKQKLSRVNMGKTHSEEHKKKISRTLKGRVSWNKGKSMSEEWKKRVSVRMKGENNPSWKGGISFEPYCPKFNDMLKEQVRNRDNRTCVLCGKSEILNGERLSVHHIDGDKMQGCNGQRWYLCVLCRTCNVSSDTPMKEFLIVSNLSSVEA